MATPAAAAYPTDAKEFRIHESYYDRVAPNSSNGSQPTAAPPHPPPPPAATRPSEAISSSTGKPRQRTRRKNNANPQEDDDPSKRRCVSTACIACRKRKSKCDGNLPACAACSQVYGTECIYDPNSDHRRKGVYKNDLDNLKTQESTLHAIIQAILNYPEDDVPALIREIRTCESLDVVAEKIVAKEHGYDLDDEEDNDSPGQSGSQGPIPTFESNLYGKMGDLRLDEGSVRYIGGTSNLIHLGAQEESDEGDSGGLLQQENAITSWTNVTKEPELILHLLNMYFTWHYTFFTTMSKQLFYRDFSLGKPPDTARRKTQYCTPLLVNAMLALGCHFTSHAGSREDPEDSATAGDHFFREAKRLIMENDEHEKPHLTTVQAFALMSVREAGCGREGKGWVYSGMSFRMACDMGLNLDSSHLTSNRDISGDEKELDAKRITFWGCFLFDKCWSVYLGRLPQLPSSLVTASKFDVFPDEDSAQWSPYTDSGFTQAHAQPARTRTVALQILQLCEISNDLMNYFYNPTDIEKTKGKATELKKLSDIHTRLEAWRRDLPKELEPKEGGLSSVLVMHMFFQLMFIHLFRPFLKYTQATSPLPSNVSPRKLCTQAAAMISKLMRLYKRSHGLRQIPNIAVYITHSACTIHLLNLPDKNAKRDIVHGLKHLEEIAEGWLCARRTLAILSFLAEKWGVEMPEEAATVLKRADHKFGQFMTDLHSPVSGRRPSEAFSNTSQQLTQQYQISAPASIGGTHHLNQTTRPSTATAGHVRDNSVSYNLPPQDANGMRALPHPSATNTPATPQVQWRSSERSTTTTGGSPSDMFGGIDQLLRDSHDWAYRDQAQLATGFENWNSVPEIDTAAWTNVTATIGGPVGGQVNTTTNTAAPTAQTGRPAYMPNGNGMPQQMDMTHWLNSMNAFNSMAASYDEDEWYQ